MSILKDAPGTVNYLSFDGVDDYVDLGTLGTWASQNLDDFTFVFDAKIYEESEQQFLFGNNGSTSLYVSLDDNSYQKNFVYITGADGDEYSLFSFDVTDNQRHELSIGYKSTDGEFTIKVDGQIIRIEKDGPFGNGNPQSFNDFTNNLRLGVVGTAFFTKMDLYDFKIYNGSTLFLHYDMSEGSGTTLVDKAGNNDATIVGATWQTENVTPAIDNIYYGAPSVQTGLQFDGSNDYVSINNDSVISTTGNFTIEMFFSTEGQTFGQTLFGQNAGSNSGRWNIDITSSNEILIFSDGLGLEENTGIFLNNNQDYWISLVRNGTDILIYIDGVLEYTVNNVSGILSDSADFRLGLKETGTGDFKGNIYEFRVWSDVRTSTEISNNLTLGNITGSENNLTLLYLIDEGSGTTLSDSAGTNDGTIVGATWESETLYPTIDRVYAGGALVYGQSLASGTHYYLIPSSSDNLVYYYNLSTPFDLDNKVINSFLSPSGLTRSDNIEISNDGTIFYVAASATNTVAKYILSTPFDLSTAGSPTLVNKQYANGQTTCFKITNNGQTYFENDSNGSIIQFNLSIPYDITTRSQTGSLGGFPSDGPGDPAFSPDGTKVVIGRRGGNDIVGGTCSVPFDLSTYSQTHVVSTADVDPSSCKWNADGTKLLVRHASPDMVNEYTVSTPYTLSGFGNERQIFDNPAFAAGGHEFNYNY